MIKWMQWTLVKNTAQCLNSCGRRSFRASWAAQTVKNLPSLQSASWFLCWCLGGEAVVATTQGFCSGETWCPAACDSVTVGVLGVGDSADSRVGSGVSGTRSGPGLPPGQAPRVPCFPPSMWGGGSALMQGCRRHLRSISERAAPLRGVWPSSVCLGGPGEGCAQWSSGSSNGKWHPK